MYVDIFGKEIMQGDRVIHASRRGSRVWLNTCTVVRVDVDKGIVLKAYPFGKRAYYYKGMSGLAVVES